LALPEVAEPATHVSCGIGNHLGEADASGSARPFSNPLFESGDGLGGNAPPWFSLHSQTSSISRSVSARLSGLRFATLSHDSVTNGRSPEVSSTAFRTQPPDLQPVPLMDMGFAVICPLARHRMPLIRFLFIGSHVCSTLLSTPPRDDALALRYHFTSIRL
jgi:hypothetical protein